MKNPNCDNDKCRDEHGEVRVLPAGAAGNLILCEKCYRHEITYRLHRNAELDDDAQFDLPSWDELDVYTGQ